jgi:hypothetical protein
LTDGQQAFLELGHGGVTLGKPLGELTLPNGCRLAAPWAPHNIRVNTLAPGYILTGRPPPPRPSRRHFGGGWRLHDLVNGMEELNHVATM